MAGVRIVAQTAEISTGTSKKTVLQLLAAANHGVEINEWSISFKGTSNTASPILVEIIEQSTSGLSGDVLTVKKLNPGDDEIVQTTALKDIDGSTQPTDTAIKFSELVHPQGGYTWQARFKGELKIPGGGRLGLAVTALAAINCVARFVGEE